VSGVNRILYPLIDACLAELWLSCVFGEICT
jgi:hypothetical protein